MLLKKKSYEAKQLSQNCGNTRGIIQHCVDFLCNIRRRINMQHGGFGLSDFQTHALHI